MGIWSKIFGARETPEQRIERARRHIDEGEPELAVRTLSSLDGEAAAAVRQRAIDLIEKRDVPEPEPELVDPLDDDDEELPRNPGEIGIAFAADGSTHVTSDGARVILNEPKSRDDGKPRSTDGLAVARGVLDAMREQPIEPRAFAFVDAALLVACANEPVPAMTDPHRQAVLDIVRAAATREPARVIAALHALPAQIVDDVGYFATFVAASFAAKELAVEPNVMPTIHVVKALLATAPELCDQLCERAPPSFAGRALIAAEAAGVVVPALVDRWRRDDDGEEWRALAIQRKALTDLDAALAAYDEDPPADETVAFDLAKLLAAREPGAAIARARELGPHVDHAEWFRGCVHGAPMAGGELVDEWIAALGPLTYHPYMFFDAVLDAAVWLGDLDRTRRCIAAAGPTGWQVAAAAHHALGTTTGDRAALLAVLYERVTPGVVAGRAIARGGFPLGAGKMVFQPDWLALTSPHPIETLAVVTALGADGPCWIA